MKYFLFLSLVGFIIFAAPVNAAETFDQVLARASGDYAERIRLASDELNRARNRIAAEKSPLVEQMRLAETRIITAESETTRLETGRDTVEEQRRLLFKEFEVIRKNSAYISTLGRDSLKAMEDALVPGEGQFFSERINALQQKLDDMHAGPNVQAALDVVDLLIARAQQGLGGYSALGDALMADNNQVLKGTYVFVGPETFFRPERSGESLTIRSRAGASQPVAYALHEWNQAAADAFFDGKPATLMLDASGGKALRLKETTGSLWQHIVKGGVVAYVILIVGFVALVMILQKIRDIAGMKVDSPATVQLFFDAMASGSITDARDSLGRLKGLTHELFAVGFHHRDQPKMILEEHLQAELLRQRLHCERRLPLLAVIATAAPLMGLLGTVIGMVKTFTLITVFGTGNAAKLSSGISEVLVTTELGLVVAIPTLVAHGFLAHRIQKNLSLLERYALQFATAIDTANAAKRSKDTKESILA